MPIHDWSKVPAGDFHHFHQCWSAEIANQLNRGRLPKGYEAKVEQKTIGSEPVVVAVSTGRFSADNGSGSGTATLIRPMAAVSQRVQDSDSRAYAKKANRIAIRHGRGQLVAAIEIVSPGNKDARVPFNEFVDKVVKFLHAGVHFVVVDLFPPTKRDPNGLYRAIRDAFADDDYVPPKDKPLTAVAFDATDDMTSYLEPLAVGDMLPGLPLFLARDVYVELPLEASCAITWQSLPESMRADLES